MRERVEVLSKQLTVQNEVVEHLADEKTKIDSSKLVRLEFRLLLSLSRVRCFTCGGCSAQTSEAAMESMAMEYSKLSQELSEANDRNAQIIAVSDGAGSPYEEDCR
jgi:hypothetical protein